MLTAILLRYVLDREVLVVDVPNECKGSINETAAKSSVFDAFRLCDDGVWICVRLVTIPIGDRRMSVLPGTTFTKGVDFMGVDVAGGSKETGRRFALRPDCKRHGFRYCRIDLERARCRCHAKEEGGPSWPALFAFQRCRWSPTLSALSGCAEAAQFLFPKARRPPS